MQADAVAQPGLGTGEVAPLALEVGRRDQALRPLQQLRLHRRVLGEGGVEPGAAVGRQVEGGHRRQGARRLEADGADRVGEQRLGQVQAQPGIEPADGADGRQPDERVGVGESGAHGGEAALVGVALEILHRRRPGDGGHGRVAGQRHQPRGGVGPAQACRTQRLAEGRLAAALRAVPLGDPPGGPGGVPVGVAAGADVGAPVRLARSGAAP
ncbi:MAG: hypothetical protein U1E52_00575 [Geminicoccaceae bacterium]